MIALLVKLIGFKIHQTLQNVYLRQIVL